MSRNSKARNDNEKSVREKQFKDKFKDTRLTSLLGQRLFNHAIRINRPMNWKELEDYLQNAMTELLKLDELRLQQEAEAAKVQRSASVPATPALKVEDTSFYRSEMRLQAEVLTGLWRLRGKLMKPGTDEPLEEMKRAYRHFETAWDALINAGYRVEDYTKQAFRTGMKVDVLAYEEAPGITSEIVLETVKPGIFYNDIPIQRGEVIVGTPEPQS
jgi:hypothetical protein